MMRSVLVSTVVIAAALALTPTAARADASGVGLGVAAGVAYSPTKLQQGTVQRQVGTAFSWGFFVDIPLLTTFYISPAAMLYELDTGHGNRPATDVDLNFKFIVPIGPLHVGAGLTGGITNTEVRYGHFGLLGYLSYNLISNLDAFVLIQYKRLVRNGPAIDYVHGYLGGMFRF